MNAKIYERFKKFEKQITQAKNINYARFSHVEFKEFAEIVAEWRGKPLTPNEKSCTRCLLDLVKSVGKDYDDYTAKKAERDAKKKEKEAQKKEQENGSTQDESEEGGR